MRASQAQWRERVREWRASGQSAREFADRLGVSPSTLTYWGWRFRKVAPPSRTKRRGGRSSGSTDVRFVELAGVATQEQRFELELGNGRSLRIPASFDSNALERLLQVLEDRGDASR